MGMGRECGAVTGALMVLGLKVQEASSEKETRYRVYDLVKEFVRFFEEKRGTIICKDLLGVDLAPRGKRQGDQGQPLSLLCGPAFGRDAAQFLADMKP